MMLHSIARYTGILLLFTVITGYTQQRVSGRVIDNSKKSIPFAHVLIAESNRGTVTNSHGEFQLYLQPTDREILITSIGYKSKRVLLDVSQPYYEVELTEDLVLLHEVVVTPKDYAQELIKNAIKNISKNYPQNSELISGFLRERFSKDSLGKEYYHVVESQLEVLKESYKESHKSGLVKLQKSVNVTESEVTNEMRIYAGGHLAHRFDFVMKRDGFLDSAKMKKYQYEIIDTLKYDGIELIDIKYLKNDSSEYGNVFIDLADLAIVKIEHFQDADRARNLFDSHKRIYLKVSTEYFQNQGVWRVGYVNYETKFTDKTSFYLNSVFSTHDFSPFNGEIPYHERLHYSQYMLEATKTADTSDWKGINRTVAEAGKKQTETKKRKKVIDFRKLEYGLELYHTPYKINTHSISLQNSSIDFNASITESQGVSQGVKMIMAYRFTDKWRLNFSTLGNLYGARLRDWGIGVSYRKQLGSHSRFSIEPQLSMHVVQYTLAAGTVSLKENLYVNGIKLNSDRIKIFTGTTSSNFSTGMSLRYELAYRWSINLGFTHFIEINSSNGILLLEDENVLTSQYVFLKDGRKGLSVSRSSDVINLSYYFTTGFLYRL